MRRRRHWLWLGGAAVAVFVAANSLFVVGRNTEAVLVELGRPVSVINSPGSDEAGLRAKIPLLQSVVRFDRRDQALDAGGAQAVSSDGQTFIVDAALRYRIVRPLAFYEQLRDQDLAASRIAPIVEASVGQALARAKGADILSGSLDGPMAEALADLRSRTRRFGIEATDLRFERVAPPPAQAQATMQRMRAQFVQQAAKIRADGQAKSREIMAEADKDSTVTLAQANAKAFAIRGEGDAKAAAIYDASFGRDPGFAAFYRSLQAYEGIVDEGRTTLVVPADTAFLKYFRFGPKGR